MLKFEINQYRLPGATVARVIAAPPGCERAQGLMFVGETAASAVRGLYRELAPHLADTFASLVVVSDDPRPARFADGELTWVGHVRGLNTLSTFLSTDGTERYEFVDHGDGRWSANLLVPTRMSIRLGGCAVAEIRTHRRRRIAGGKLPQRDRFESEERSVRRILQSLPTQPGIPRFGKAVARRRDEVAVVVGEKGPERLLLRMKRDDSWSISRLTYQLSLDLTLRRPVRLVADLAEEARGVEIDIATSLRRGSKIRASWRRATNEEFESQAVGWFWHYRNLEMPDPFHLMPFDHHNLENSVPIEIGRTAFRLTTALLHAKGHLDQPEHITAQVALWKDLPDMNIAVRSSSLDKGSEQERAGLVRLFELLLGRIDPARSVTCARVLPIRAHSRHARILEPMFFTVPVASRHDAILARRNLPRLLIEAGISEPDAARIVQTTLSETPGA